MYIDDEEFKAMNFVLNELCKELDDIKNSFLMKGLEK